MGAHRIRYHFCGRWQFVRSRSDRTGDGPIDVAPILSKKSAFRVCGKYVMDLEGFERFTLPLLRQNKHRNAKRQKQCVFVIDEIGKMELFSKRFAELVDRLLNARDILVIATVPSKHRIAFVERVKRR